MYFYRVFYYFCLNVGFNVLCFQKIHESYSITVKRGWKGDKSSKTTEIYHSNTVVTIRFSTSPITSTEIDRTNMTKHTFKEALSVPNTFQLLTFQTWLQPTRLTFGPSQAKVECMASSQSLLKIVCLKKFKRATLSVESPNMPYIR